MHFHGLNMRMHPVMDGTTMISQYPITPGNFFDYRIPLTTDDLGTYWYHSHVGLQAMTAYGVLVVEDPEQEDVEDPATATFQANMDPGSVKFKHVHGEEGLGYETKSGCKSPYAYDESKLITLGDWWNYQNLDNISQGLMADPFVFPKSPNRLLLNGASQPGTDYPAIPANATSCNSTAAALLGVSCADAPSNCADQGGYPTLYMDYGKTYRLRFVGAMALMYMSAGILAPTDTPYRNVNDVVMDTLTLIEADGTYLDAFETKEIEIFSGQRYSALWTSRDEETVKKDGKGGVYWMLVESRWRYGPSMWVQLVYPDATVEDVKAARPPVAEGSEGVRLLPGETFGWKTPSLAPLSKPGGPKWWYGTKMPKDSEVTRSVVIDAQQVKFGASGEGKRWAENGRLYNESQPIPSSSTPLLVSTMLGNMPFPTEMEYASAMNTTLVGLAPLVGNTSTELAAASARHWGQGYSPDLNMYFASPGEVVDIIIVNRPGQTNASAEIHPWHMHSNKHWTRTIQPGTFSFSRLSSLYSSPPSGFERPIRRDTTTVYLDPGAQFSGTAVPNPEVNDGGFAVLRYKVDKNNAGFFLLHCHIAFHLNMGMATVWAVAPEELVKQSGAFWPSTQGKNANVQGLDLAYLKPNSSVAAVA